MIHFSDIKAYLDAIAKKNGKLANSPHGAFWQTDYLAFKTGQVDDLGVQIMDPANPLQSPFFLVLTDPTGFQGFRQMPGGGPFITDAAYEVTLADSTKITGQQMIANITSWLTNGFPE